MCVCVCVGGGGGGSDATNQGIPSSFPGQTLICCTFFFPAAILVYWYPD